MWNNKKFVEALTFATRAHKNQKMKYPDDLPYSVHIFSVLQFAIGACMAENEKDFDWDLMIQSALLHDVIEDTDETFSSVKEKFGERVANGVMALSKDKTLDRNIQMRESLNKIKKQPREIAVVKLADRLFNLYDKIPNRTRDKYEFYRDEAQLICDELGYASETLKSQLQKAIDEYLED